MRYGSQSLATGLCATHSAVTVHIGWPHTAHSYRITVHRHTHVRQRRKTWHDSRHCLARTLTTTGHTDTQSTLAHI
jgi:hypothetical protein